LANTTSAIRAIRENERRRGRNRRVRSAVRTEVKKARLALAQSDPQAAESAIQDAVVALDKAAQKGVIHRNAAARRKSRLMKQLNRLEQA